MDQQLPDPPPSLEPEDYYFEDGYIVFTAAYHLKRGYCCGSGCRHCPYGENSDDSTSRSQTPVGG
jgi:Family of unknown function (DUF5522)